MMHDDEEHALARGLAEEFARQAITSNAMGDFLTQISTLAGDPPSDSYLEPSERLHLIALLYHLRHYADRVSAELTKEEMKGLTQALIARGLDEEGAKLISIRAAWEHQTNLISLADQVAVMPELERRI